MDENFSVTVASDKCTDFFAHNKNSHFANVFPKAINVCDFEVALSSISYYDKYIEPVPGQVPVPDTSPFYDISKAENIIKVTTKHTNTFNPIKTSNNFSNVLAYLNDNCPSAGMNVTFFQLREKGVITSIRLEAKIPVGSKLVVSENLATILGLDTYEFESGTYTSSLGVDVSTFDSIQIDSPLGSLRLVYESYKEVQLEQHNGPPLYTTLLSDIMAALQKEGVPFALRLRKKYRTLEWSRMNPSATVQFSRYINSFLGLEETFAFRHQGSVVISDSVIFPGRPEPIKPVWSKVLIFCDAIVDQYVSGKQMKVLSTLERTESKDFSRRYFAPQTMIYKSLSKPLLNHITISLMTEHNTFLDVCEQPTVVVLHFRRKLLE